VSLPSWIKARTASLPALTAAPLVHASDDATKLEFRARYRAFVEAFCAGALRCASAPAS